MDKKYSTISFIPASDIEDAVKILQKHKEKGEFVCGEFNGKTLYSDIDDLDSAYKKITGKTKSEYDEEVAKIQEKRSIEERQHKESIHALTQEWIKKGNAIIDQKHHRYWAEIVPIRLGDLYRGMELGCCLDIIKPLNEGCEMSVAKSIIDSQGHSGMSYGLVRAMVRHFCDRGVEFFEATKD